MVFLQRAACILVFACISPGACFYTPFPQKIPYAPLSPCSCGPLSGLVFGTSNSGPRQAQEEAELLKYLKRTLPASTLTEETVSFLSSATSPAAASLARDRLGNVQWRVSRGTRRPKPFPLPPLAPEGTEEMEAAVAAVAGVVVQ